MYVHVHDHGEAPQTKLQHIACAHNYSQTQHYVYHVLYVHIQLIYYVHIHVYHTHKTIIVQNTGSSFGPGPSAS